jgi:tRNA dimethylallyltransferase
MRRWHCGVLPDPESLYFVCGPTASGKSAHALMLAREGAGEIVNADAFQLYQGLEVLSAAPGQEERSTLPHHLYSVLPLSEGIDAMGYVHKALPVIEEITSRGKTAIITGGSGLYLKFLSHGPSPVPPGDPAMREHLDQLTLDELARQLTALDPVEAARTDLQNRRYVSRALEICLITGGRCSDIRDDWERASQAREHRLRGCYLQRSRADLHQRIHLRTRLMLEGGAIEEVRQMQDAAPTVEKAIGIPEIRDYLAGKTDLPTCEERINAATRQYAKRQETWFRREKWLNPIEMK